MANTNPECFELLMFTGVTMRNCSSFLTFSSQHWGSCQKSGSLWYGKDNPHGSCGQLFSLSFQFHHNDLCNNPSGPAKALFSFLLSKEANDVLSSLLPLNFLSTCSQKLTLHPLFWTLSLFIKFNSQRFFTAASWVKAVHAWQLSGRSRTSEWG